MGLTSFLVIFAVALSVAYAQLPESCDALLAKAQRDSVQLFISTDATSRAVRDAEMMTCLQNDGRLKRVYRCRDGFTATIASLAEGNDLTQIFDVTNLFVVCNEDTTVQPPATQPPVVIPELDSCPNGPTFLSQYLFSENNLCAFSCSFPVSIFG